MNTTIIEQLACLEINNLILQPPFHLISNIQWNDKGLSFDGDIEVYSDDIKGSDFIGRVPVQVKGTTKYKKIQKLNKIKHSVSRRDLEVYYKDGNGVIYFVVTINPKTLVKQAYYRLLAPLDLKDILYKLESNGNNSVTLPFKKLEKGSLESLCRTTLNIVEKQPKKLIEASSEKNFSDYKLSFINISKDSDIFEEPAYVYGIIENIEIPLKLAHLQEIRSGANESVIIDNEEINLTYEIKMTVEKINLTIEDTLTIEIDKTNESGKIHLGKIKTLRSYIKCLKLLKYHLEHNELPFEGHRYIGKINEKECFQDINEDIEIHEELIEICNQIGISQDYLFNADEDFPSLFNGIISIFKNKKYELLKINGSLNLEEAMIYKLQLSDYVTVMVMYLKNDFIGFFSKEALEQIGGFVPKRELKADQNNWEPNNWDKDYWKASIYATQKIEDMEACANFNFDILKLSYNEKYHDISNDLTINYSLEFIKYYDQFSDNKYLDLALELNQRFLEKSPESDIALVNIYLIKTKQDHKLSEEEQQKILDILERAEKHENRMLSFACEVLLENKLRSKKILNSLIDSEQDIIKDFPIFNAYSKLK